MDLEKGNQQRLRRSSPHGSNLQSLCYQQWLETNSFLGSLFFFVIKSAFQIDAVTMECWSSSKLIHKKDGDTFGPGGNARKISHSTWRRGLNGAGSQTKWNGNRDPKTVPTKIIYQLHLGIFGTAACKLFSLDQLSSASKHMFMLFSQRTC